MAGFFIKKSGTRNFAFLIRTENKKYSRLSNKIYKSDAIR
jgi:hypothetical protein